MLVDRQLNFQLNLTTQEPIQVIEKWFRDEWQDFEIRWGGNFVSGENDDNWFEVDEYNGEPDISHYVLVTSKYDHPPTREILQQQVEFARSLISRLEEKGVKVEYNGFFADYL